MRTTITTISKSLALCLATLQVVACRAEINASSREGGVTGGEPTIDSTSLPVVVDALGVLAAKPGEVVEVTGQNFRPGLKAVVGGIVVDFSVSSPTTASFTMPAGTAIGLVEVDIMANDKAVKTLSLISDSAGDDIPFATFAPDLICQGLTFRNARGEIKKGLKVCSAAALADCTEDGQTDCRANDAAKAAKLSSFTDADIRYGVTIAGVAGSLTGAPIACSSDGATGCLANAAYRAALMTGLDSKVLSGESVAGISGNVTLPAIADVKNGVQFGVGGTGRTGTDSPDFPDVGNVRNSDTVNGATGALLDCADGGINCVAVAGFPAARVHASQLHAGNIKRGVTIGGVVGAFPSSGYPLPRFSDSGATTTTVADGGITTDLTNFITQLTTDGDFEFWDQSGIRRTGAGDSEIADVNVVAGVDFESLSVEGSAPGGALPNAWDLRAGVTVGSVTGKLKANCRNGSNGSIFDMSFPGQSATVNTGTPGSLTITGHGLGSNAQVRLNHTSEPSGLNNWTTYYVIVVDANTIRLSSIAGPGAAANIASVGSAVTVHPWNDGTLQAWDTIDDYNAGSSALAAWPVSWDSNFCGGIDTVGSALDDDNVWRDVTTGGCDVNKCRMKDQISGLEWSKTLSTSMRWGAAVEACRSLATPTNDGVGGWRLPTQKELMGAYSHGIRSAADTNWITLAQLDGYYYWSSSTASNYPHLAWSVILAEGIADYAAKTIAYRVACVR